MEKLLHGCYRWDGNEVVILSIGQAGVEKHLETPELSIEGSLLMFVEDTKCEDG